MYQAQFAQNQFGVRGVLRLSQMHKLTDTIVIGQVAPLSRDDAANSITTI